MSTLAPPARATYAISLVPFDALSGADVYEVLALRQRVFVVEQRCAYQDADGLDAAALHLLVRDEGRLVAYLRILEPGVRFQTPTIGRVIVSPDRRDEQLGRRVMQEALTRLRVARGPIALSLSAQAHLARFYGSLGFTPTSAPYDEDGISHIDMRREPENG